MGMIQRLDHTGDSVLAEWDALDEISVEAAKEIFDALVADPLTNLGQVEDATKNIARKVTEFDPTAETIIVWKQFAGG